MQPSCPLTITGQLVSTRANDATAGGGQIYLNGSSGNRIDFGAAGLALPSFTSRSAGTKLVLYPQVDSANADYACGVATGALWHSVPQNTSSFQFRWYAGNTAVATLSGTGNLSLPAGQLTSTRANDATTGGGQIYLNGGTGNRIDFGTAGIGSPTFNTRSAGTKIVLYPVVSASAVDYAMGIDTNTMWSSIPTSTNQFRWYAGQTPVATLSGTGNLDVTGTLTAGGVSVQNKPYVAVRVAANVILSGNNNGQIATANMSLQAGRASGQIYTFTFSPAHPDGTNYMVMATANTGATSSSFYVCTTKVESSTSFSVWCRNASNTIVDGDFFVMTVP